MLYSNEDIYNRQKVGETCWDDYAAYSVYCPVCPVDPPELGGKLRLRAVADDLLIVDIRERVAFVFAVGVSGVAVWALQGQLGAKKMVLKPSGKTDSPERKSRSLQLLG